MRNFERFDARMRGDDFGNKCSIIGTAAAILGGVMAASGVATAAVGAHAAGKAADAQVDATKYAADLQKESSDKALAFQERQFATQQENLQPWLQTGKTNLAELAKLMAPGGSLYTAPTFTAPTVADMMQDPGYQFRLQEGQKALERSAAAKGTVLGGGALKALTRYGQDMGSQEYGQVYSRAMDKYNTQRTNQNDLYNRLAGLAGTGQTAANQINSASQDATRNYTGTVMQTGQNLGNLAVEGGQARASGYINGANAWMGGINSGVGSLMDLMLMSKMQKANGAGGWV